MSNPRLSGKALIILGILFIPAISYFLLSRGDNQFQHLEIFGPRELPPSGTTDTTFHTVMDFSLIDQDSMPVSFEKLNADIYIANFFFATCKTICPNMSKQMKRVQENLPDNYPVKILSFTVDPVHDTVAALNAYAQLYEADNTIWHFITGDKKQIYDLARYGFYLTAMEGDGGPDDFIHSEKFILLDRERRIRGYYDGTDPEDVKRLLDEVLVLQWEQTHNSSN